MTRHPVIPSCRTPTFQSLLRQRFTPFLCVFINLYCPSLWALNDPPEPRTTLDFSLRLSRDRFTLKSGEANFDIRQNRIGVEVFNTENRRLQYGLLTGASYLSQDDDALSAGAELKGFHLGLALRTHIGKQPRLTAQAYYLYQEARHEEENRNLTWNNYEWGTQASLEFILNRYSWLTLGALYHELDAERRVSGDVQDTENLLLREKATAYMTLEIPAAPDGRIGFSLRRGGQEGISLIFSRGF